MIFEYRALHRNTRIRVAWSSCLSLSRNSSMKHSLEKRNAHTKSWDGRWIIIYRARGVVQRNDQVFHLGFASDVNKKIPNIGMWRTQHAQEAALLSLFGALPFHALKYNSQRLNRSYRGLELVTNKSKQLTLIKAYREWVRNVRDFKFEMHAEACIKNVSRTLHIFCGVSVSELKFVFCIWLFWWSFLSLF